MKYTLQFDRLEDEVLNFQITMRCIFFSNCILRFVV
uniref:Uncharacterized protein n=1 Tax=Arundo donax TaxID=35708 RepID=A0A0A9C833_ARUDO